MSDIETAIEHIRLSIKTVTKDKYSKYSKNQQRLGGFVNGLELAIEIIESIQRLGDKNEN